MASVTTARSDWLRAMVTQLGRQLGRSATLVLIVLALLAGVATYIALFGTGSIEANPATIPVLLIVDTALLLTLVAIGFWNIVRLWRARISGAAGARLHTRLMTWFSLIAVIPTLVVAVLLYVSLNRGMEAWFSERVQEA